MASMSGTSAKITGLVNCDLTSLLSFLELHPCSIKTRKRARNNVVLEQLIFLFISFYIDSQIYQ